MSNNEQGISNDEVWKSPLSPLFQRSFGLFSGEQIFQFMSDICGVQSTIKN